MKIMVLLMKDIFAMKFPWNIWVGWMALINMAGAIFINRIEGQLALIAMIGAAMVMTIIYSRVGFVRLLGMGHIIFWTPLVGWFVYVLWNNQPHGYFLYWMIALSLTNAISLIIDAVDVARYYRGGG